MNKMVITAKDEQRSRDLQNAIDQERVKRGYHTSRSLTQNMSVMATRPGLTSAQAAKLYTGESAYLTT